MPKKLNPFAKYMFSLKKSYPDYSMAEIQQLAGKNWEKMDKSERDKYKNDGESADLKKPSVESSRIKYNCLGQNIEDVKRVEREKKNKELKDAEYIENVIKTAIQNNQLQEEEIYFFSASYYVKKQNEIYPAEIAIAKFSLGQGITDVFHMFINPGELPLGFAYLALEHSKKTHRLTIPPNTFGEKSYIKVLDEILKFLEAKELSSNCVPPFYVFGDFCADDYQAALMTLEKIADENKCGNGFRVLKAEQFLFELNRQILTYYNRDDRVPFRSVIQAKDAFRHDNFRYNDIGCELHNEEDNSQMCVLSKVKRWGFTIVEHCGLDSLEKIPGQHFPVSKNELYCEDFDEDEEDPLESCLTESFHQLNLESSLSQIDTQSCLSEEPRISSVSSALDLTLGPSTSFIQRLRSRANFATSSIKSSDSTITFSPSDLSQRLSVQCSVKSNTNIDDSVKDYEESWTKKIVNNHLEDEGF